MAKSGANRVLAADRRQAEPQDAALQAAHLFDLGEQVVTVGEQLDAAAVDDLADCRQRDAPARSIEQGRADFVFELLHRLADGRLGGEHRLGGARKTALTDDLDEGAQRSQLHDYSIYDFILVNQFIL
jgi:hypothetical protein